MNFNFPEGIPIPRNTLISQINLRPITEAQKEDMRIRHGNRHNSKSLQELCINNIVENIPSYWNKKEFKNMPEHPFEFLPTELMETIIARCKDCYVYSEFLSYTEILLTSGRRAITLGPSYLKNIDETYNSIDLVTNKCQKLEQLNIENIEISTHEMHALLQNLKTRNRLKLLNLNSCAVVDETMNIISGMKSLQNLSISNTKVTNIGISCLCNSENKSIRNIELLHTKITKLGVLQMLKSFPDLSSINHHKISDALVLWRKRYPGRKLQLKSLGTYILTNNSLDVLDICPNLESVSGNFLPKKNGPLPHFTVENLQKLKNLRIHFQSPWFDSSTVTTMSLVNCTIDVMDLLLRFPNLENLCFNQCNFVREDEKFYPDRAQKIKVLIIDGIRSNSNNTDFVSLWIFSYMISSTNLKSLELYDDPFRNKLFPDLSVKTYFQNLKTNFLTSERIEKIILANENIESISIERLGSHPCSEMCNTINGAIRAMINGKTTCLRANSRHSHIIDKYDEAVENGIFNEIQ